LKIFKLKYSFQLLLIGGVPVVQYLTL
jgi:hypothetical protein